MKSEDTNRQRPVANEQGMTLSSSKSKLEQGSWLNNQNQKAPSHCGGCEYIVFLWTYWSHLLDHFGKGFLLKMMSAKFHPSTQRAQTCRLGHFTSVLGPRKTRVKRTPVCFWKRNLSHARLLTLPYTVLCIYFAKSILILHTERWHHSPPGGPVNQHAVSSHTTCSIFSLLTQPVVFWFHPALS